MTKPRNTGARVAYPQIAFPYRAALPGTVAELPCLSRRASPANKSPRSKERYANLRPVALTALCVLLAAALNAQDAPLILKSETREVLVDAVAIDKKNQFVRDLTLKDFRLWEDNKEQTLTNLSLESASANPERSNKHYIAMLFDTSTAGQASQTAMRQEATHFVDAFASPDRYMAVINYGNGLQITQNFTADSDRVKKALGLVQSTTVNNTGIYRDVPRAPAGSNNPVGLAMQIDTSPYRNFLASVQNLASSLSVIRGRKALVLFSGGAPMTSDLTRDINATVAACNKANVGLYTVGGYTGGTADRTVTGATNTRLTAADIAAMTKSAPDDILRSLAEGTGGLMYATTNDLAASLGKVALEQDQYYLLSYTPTIDAPEGACHELNVKVDRGDVEIRARKGYCTSKPVDALSGKPAGQALEARAASSEAASMTATMQLPWFYQAPNIARVTVAMDIVPSAMKFQKEKGKLHGEFNLAGAAYKTDGSVAAHFSDAVKLDFDTQKQADEFLRSPYHYMNQFKIGPGQYNFRVAFSSDTAGTQGFGKVELPLNIEPWNGQVLSASGLALSNQTLPAADLSSGLDASLLEGQRPLVAKGTEVVPAGTSVFHSNEPATAYFEIYEPLLTGSTTPVPIGVRMRVLDSAGQQKVDTGVKTVGSFERPGNPVVPVVSPIPMENLTAGSWKLEVTVMRQTGDPVVRTAPFTVR